MGATVLQDEPSGFTKRHYTTKKLIMSTDPPLIIIFSDSQYAFNAVDGTESGLSNTQLYTKIRQFLNDSKML